MSVRPRSAAGQGKVAPQREDGGGGLQGTWGCVYLADRCMPGSHLCTAYCQAAFNLTADQCQAAWVGAPRGWCKPEWPACEWPRAPSGEVMQPLQELCRQHNKMGNHSPMSKDNKITERSLLGKIKFSFAVQLSFCVWQIQCNTGFVSSC